MEYGCIGEHLSHSFSKEIHNSLADYRYSLKELSREELPCFMNEKNFKAINVTIPYKQDVIPFLDYISDEAKAINAVNTIVNDNGKLYGYNTDFYGLRALIQRVGIIIEGKKVAILGSGGTSNTAFAVAHNMGALIVLKVSRNAKSGYITYDELYEKYSDVQIIINTTPCGMFPNTGETSVSLDKLPNVTGVVDAVYNPLSSQLIVDAKEKGIRCTGGLYMLVSQAAYAVEKFINKPVNENNVESVFKNLYKSKMNIVLIGMPSCGKSTVGKLLSQKTGKAFVDTDEAIVESQGMEIPAIFNDKGEEYFRDVEKDVVYNISKENNIVISTGGGVILNERNIHSLKGNGRIYFLDRPLEKLVATSDRPLSKSKDALRKLYEERFSLYKKYADVVVNADGTVEDVVKRIEADYYEYSCD